MRGFPVRFGRGSIRLVHIVQIGQIGQIGHAITRWSGASIPPAMPARPFTARFRALRLATVQLQMPESGSSAQGQYNNARQRAPGTRLR